MDPFRRIIMYAQSAGLSLEGGPCNLKGVFFICVRSYSALKLLTASAFIAASQVLSCDNTDVKPVVRVYISCSSQS